MLLCSSLLAASVSSTAAVPPPNPRIIGGWTNCPQTCADSCVPPLGPAKTAWGSNISKAECMQTCGTDGSGPAMCDAKDAGVPHAKAWGPSFSHAWGATAILPGKFGGAAVAPVAGSMSSYPHRWVTVGGAGTSSADWKKTAESDVLGAKALGCAFDEEGGVSAADAKEWIQQMRAKHADWSFVYVPQCGTGILPYDPAGGGCDYAAPMMYYSNGDSYPGMDITAGSGNSADCLAQLQKAGWPASRTVLTFQSWDAWRVSGHMGQAAPPAAAAAVAPVPAGNATAPALRGSRGALFSGGGGSGETTTGGIRGADACTGCVPGSSEGNGMLQTMGKLLGDHAITVKYWGTSSVTLQGPYAGVLGWPAQCGGSLHRCWPAMDEANIKTVVGAMK